MTNEEAKMQIQAIPEKIWDQLSEPDREAMEMAFSALEKQQPMETGPDELGISVRNPVITPCGNCGTELTDRMWSYCPWCGQKIKWRKR